MVDNRKESFIENKTLKTYPHEGVCLGAKTCGRCRDLREEEAANENTQKELASIEGKKIVKVLLTDDGTFVLTLEDGRRVSFASPHFDIQLKVYEPETKKG